MVRCPGCRRRSSRSTLLLEPEPEVLWRVDYCALEVCWHQHSGRRRKFNSLQGVQWNVFRVGLTNWCEWLFSSIYKTIRTWDRLITFQRVLWLVEWVRNRYDWDLLHSRHWTSQVKNSNKVKPLPIVESEFYFKNSRLLSFPEHLVSALSSLDYEQILFHIPSCYYSRDLYLYPMPCLFKISKLLQLFHAKKTFLINFYFFAPVQWWHVSNSEQVESALYCSERDFLLLGWNL